MPDFAHFIQMETNRINILWLFGSPRIDLTQKKKPSNKIFMQEACQVFSKVNTIKQKEQGGKLSSQQKIKSCSFV